MSSLRVVEELGRTRDGGSCSVCSDDYRGAPFEEGRGVRFLGESSVDPGVVEPYNVCARCWGELPEVDS